METTTTEIQEKVLDLMEALNQAREIAATIGWVSNGSDDWNVGGLFTRQIDGTLATVTSAAYRMAERNYAEMAR